MDDKEMLGKVAYDAFITGYDVNVPQWDEIHPDARNMWVAAAQAVIERVMELQRAAVEASE